MRKATVFLLFMCCTLFAGAGELRWRPLAAYVPDGAILTVRAKDSAQRYERLKGSPLVRAFTEGRVGEAFKKSGKLAEAKARIREVEEFLQTDLLETIGKLAGEEAILGFYPPKEKARDDPHVALVLRGKEGTDAGAIIKGINDRFVQAGELEQLSSSALGETELWHYRNDEGDDIFEAAYGEHSVIASSKALVEKVESLAAGRSTQSILSNPRVLRTCRGLAEKSQLLFFVDMDVLLETGRDDLDRKKVPEVVKAALEAIEGAAYAVQVNPSSIKTCLRVKFESEKLPDFLKECVSLASAPCSFAKCLRPQEVLAGAAFHIRLGDLAAGILSELPEPVKSQAKKKISGLSAMFLQGHSLVEEVLPALGPNLAFVATDIDSTDSMPGEVTALVEINKKTGYTVLRGLAKGLHALAQPVGKEAGRPPVSLVEEKGMLRITGKAQGNTPTLIVRPDALIVSSSKVAACKIASNLENPPPYNLAQEIPSFKSCLFGLNCPLLSRWIARHAGLLAGNRARRTGVPKAQVKNELEVLGAFLSRLEYCIAYCANSGEKFDVVSELRVRS